MEQAWAANQLSDVPHTATLDCNELPGIGFKKAGRILATAAVRLLVRGEEAQKKGTLRTLLRSAENAGILAQQGGPAGAAGIAAGGGAARGTAGGADMGASAAAAAAAAAAVASMPNLASMDPETLRVCLAAAAAAAAAAAGTPSATSGVTQQPQTHAQANAIVNLASELQQHGLGQWAVQAAAEVAMKAAAAVLQQQQQHAAAAAAADPRGAGSSVDAGPSSLNLLTAAAVGPPDMRHFGGFAAAPSHAAAGGNMATLYSAQGNPRVEPAAAPGPFQQMVLEAALADDCNPDGGAGAGLTTGGELECTLSGPRSSTDELLQAVFDGMGDPGGARALTGNSGGGPSGGSNVVAGVAEPRKSDGAAWDLLGQMFDSYCGGGAPAAATDTQASVSLPHRQHHQPLQLPLPHVSLQHPALAMIAAAEAAGPTGGFRLNGGSITMLDAWVDAQNDEHVDAAVVAAMVAGDDDVPRLHDTLGPVVGGAATAACADGAGLSTASRQHQHQHPQQQAAPTPTLLAPMPVRGGGGAGVSALADVSPGDHSPGSDGGGLMAPPQPRPPICISPPPEDLDPSELRDDFPDLPLTASMFRISNMSIADGPPAPGSARPSASAFGANPFGQFGAAGGVGGGGTPNRLSNALSILRAGSAGCMDMLMVRQDGVSGDAVCMELVWGKGGMRHY